MPTSEGQEVLEILKESIETGQEYIPRLINGLDQIANLHRKGLQLEANAMFYDSVEGLEWLLTVIAAATKIPTLINKTEKFNEKMVEFQTILKNLMDAFSGQDFILVSDIIEYELIDNLNFWQEIFQQMNQNLKKEFIS